MAQSGWTDGHPIFRAFPEGVVEVLENVDGSIAELADGSFLRMLVGPDAVYSFDTMMVENCPNRYRNNLGRVGEGLKPLRLLPF